MVGGGVFSLPQSFGEATGVLGAIIAWTIAGTGMLMLAFVFQSLAMRRPDLDSGIYIYAQTGFGNYAGFNSAFGYWASNVAGNVFFMVFTMTTLGEFFPGLGQGNTILAVVIASVGVWIFHYPDRARRPAGDGRSTGIVTVAKLMPILAFIVIVRVRVRPADVRRQHLGRRDANASARCGTRSPTPCWSRRSSSSASRAPASTRGWRAGARTSAGRP